MQTWRHAGGAAALAAAVLALVPEVAHAHSGDPALAGFGAGLAHPLSGFDHLLALIAIGLWTGLNPTARPWPVAAAMLAAIVFGGMLGLSGAALPAVEAGVAASVLILGLLLAVGLRLPPWAALAVVTTFALVHGYAHGITMPAGAVAPVYGTGLVLVSGVLWLAGFGLARQAVGLGSVRLIRGGGLALSLVGLALIAQSL